MRALALLGVALAGLAAGTVATGDLRLRGGGDWRAASEGLYHSGQAGVLGAGRRAIVHFHHLDGRAGVLTVLASARRAGAPVSVSASAGAPWFDTVLGDAPASIAVELPRGAHDVDLRLDATGLFRVHEIGLRRPRTWPSELVRVLPSLIGAIVLLAFWRTGPVTAMAWAVLAALGTAAAWMAIGDGAVALVFDRPVRDALRLAGLAGLWLAGLATARSRVASGITVAATVFLLHLPTLAYGFHADDWALAHAYTARDLVSALHGDFDPTGLIAGYYRPVVSVSWAFDHWLHGDEAAGYHATNVVVHAAAGVALLALLRALAVEARPALLAALAFVAHPITASTAAWIGGRADTFSAVFYLAALVAFCSPRTGLGRDALLAALAWLSLASKEMAVSLPLSALVLDRVARPPGTPPRTRRLVILAGVVAIYLAMWLALFRHGIGQRSGTARLWAGFDPRQPGDWLRLLPTLYALLLLPPRYATWWDTPLRGWPIWYLALGVVVLVALWWIARTDPLGGRCFRAGALLAVVTYLPLLGLKGLLDFYRSGYLVPVAVALMVAGVATRARHSPRTLAAMALVLAVAWGWLSIDAARAWGREGFHVRMAVRWRLAEPDWPDGRLTPEMAARWRRTIEEDRHAFAWAYPDAPWP